MKELKIMEQGGVRDQGGKESSVASIEVEVL